MLFFRKQNVDQTCHTNSSVAGKMPREHSLTVWEDSKEITSYHSGHSKSTLSCYPVTSWAVTIAQWPFLALHLTWTVSQPHYISYGKKGTRLLESVFPWKSLKLKSCLLKIIRTHCQSIQDAFFRTQNQSTHSLSRHFPCYLLSTCSLIAAVQ